MTQSLGREPVKKQRPQPFRWSDFDTWVFVEVFFWDCKSQNAGRWYRRRVASWYFNVKFIGRRRSICGGGDNSDHVFIR